MSASFDCLGTNCLVQSTVSDYFVLVNLKIILIFFCLSFCFIAPLSGPSSAGWVGKEFALSFMQNYVQNYGNPRFQLSITGIHANSKVTVQVPSLNFKQEITVNAKEGVTVILPTAVELSGSQRSPNTVRIEASADVTVSSFNFKLNTADSAVVYPTTDWGTEYFIFTPTGTHNPFKEFSVTNGKESNKVEIFPKGTIIFQGSVYTSGSQMVIDLQPYESVQLQSTDDLSGTRVASQRPVAVFTGHSCAMQLSACDHVYEQLLPVSSWGSNFIVPPLSFQKQYDSIYIQASQPTRVTVQYGNRGDVLTLSRGQSVELRYRDPETLSIQSDKGIQVLLFFNGVSGSYDPFLMTILPTERFCTSYSLDPQEGFDNQALIVAQTSAIAALRIDGTNLPSNVQWKKVTGTDFSWVAIPCTYISGRNRQTVCNSGSPFALYSIGGTQANSYGSPAQCMQPGTVHTL